MMVVVAAAAVVVVVVMMPMPAPSQLQLLLPRLVAVEPLASSNGIALSTVYSTGYRINIS